MCSDPRTRAYVARRTAEGKSTKEIQRCLKQYIVRELYPLILADLKDAAFASWHRSVNAVAESFFHTLKTELISHLTFRNREEAKQVVFEYIEVFYNRERLHSANGYLSPVDYEAQQYAA